MKLYCYFTAMYMLTLVSFADPIYTWAHESLNSLNPTPSTIYELDLDQNSVIDLIFVSDWTGCRVVPQNESKLTLREGHIAALAEDVEIGAIAPHDCTWLSAGRLLNLSDAATPSAAGNILGEYFATNAFFGVQFFSGEATHYAWVRVYNRNDYWPGGWLMDYAYESTPDASIQTTLIPEPTTIGLIILGLAVFVTRRKRE
ncbi:MAG: PEP-CTERM sorting domain-containing protein [Kiritimatiellae bacterium]|nr:PEP-CTERM sorting domain-containing protein [Kiritimatiellia bacterium]